MLRSAGRLLPLPLPQVILPASAVPAAFSVPRSDSMASNASFDVSTGADLQEVDNAVNQTLKEIAQRYDFKGTHCTVDFDRTKAEIRLARTTSSGWML